MADFEIADKERAANEGGASFDPEDDGNVVRGGIVVTPTYAGIAPVFWPEWAGWKIIKKYTESMVKMPQYGTAEFRPWVSFLNKQLKADPQLQLHVKEFYKRNFWDAHRMGEVRNQAVATWIYDHIVNAGARGVKWAQEAAGATVDGDMGAKSIAAINAADPASLLEKMKGLARDHRIRRVQKHPAERRFLFSWLTRDGLSREEINEILRTV